MGNVRRIQILLLASAAILVAVVGVFIARAPRDGDEAGLAASAAGSPSPVPTATPRSGAAAASGTPGQSGVKFESVTYTFGRRRFSLEADRLTELKEGATLLSGHVRVEAEAQDGHTYIVRTREAELSADKQHVRASNGVQVDREDGLRLDARWVEHDQPQGIEAAGGGVWVRAGERLLTCNRAEYHVRQDAYQLEGGISAIERTAKGTFFAAGEHLAFSRKTGELVLREAVNVVAGRLSVRADRLDLRLADGKPREAVFRGLEGREVEVEVHDPGTVGCPRDSLAAAPVRILHARGMRILFDALGEARSIRPLDPGGPVLVEGFDLRERLWTLDARTLEVTLAGAGRIERLEAAGADWRSDDGTQRLQAPEVDVAMDASGTLGVTVFPKGVAITQGERLLTGKRARLAEGLLVVDAEPRLTAGASRLRARRIELQTRTGRLVATGDVETESPQSPRSTLPLKGSGGLVRFRAERMESEGDGGAVTYTGSARAWQGGDVLQADEIRADKDFAGLRATGSVRVLLTSDPTRRMQASADRLSLAGRDVVLDGTVRLEMPDAHIEGDHARIVLGESGGPMERLEAEGEQVRVERQGVRATARRVVHEVASGRTDLFGAGSNVRVIDERGQETWGDSLILWRRGDRISLGSSKDAVVLSRVGAGPSGTRP